jgi:hypothetical protein
MGFLVIIEKENEQNQYYREGLILPLPGGGSIVLF